MLFVDGAREAASSGAGAEVALYLVSSQESVLTVHVLSIDKSGNDLSLQTQSPGSSRLRSNGGLSAHFTLGGKLLLPLIPVPTEAAHVH